jgi:Xaa-Pro aminopeptidase
MQIVGPNFNADALIRADQAAARCVAEIADVIQPGMTQEEGTRLAREIIKSAGAQRHWHQPIIRFGAETLKTFREPTDSQTRLADGDLFYIDIGPVFEGQEADRGDTFRAGTAHEPGRLIEAARETWKAVADAWRTRGLTGRELYASVHERAADSGFVQHSRVQGHRVGDWPHGEYTRGTLANATVVPEAGLWILEIHFICSTSGRAAFFEAPLA